MNWIFDPWPWYVSGPLIALVMMSLLLAGKRFGMSSNLRTICTVLGAGKHAEFFRFDWKSQRWNLLVILGTAIGGFLASRFLTNDKGVRIAASSQEKLKALGFESTGSAYLPDELFSTEALTNPQTLFFLLLGGFLVGFGTRYAGGCTSGHAISGLSNLQLPSLIAVIGFFAGGLLMVHFFFPLLF
jgi:uncharacterized membrane protein YedE/YeeE